MVSSRFSQNSISNSGFSLLELITVLAVMGISAAIAIPAYDGHIKRTQIRSAMADFITAIAYARSHASANGDNVHVLSKSSSDWGSGWCVTKSSSSCGTSSTTLIKEFEGPSRANMTGDSSTALYSFDVQGHLVTTSASHISLCSKDGTGKKITVLALGQALAQDCECNDSNVCSSGGG